MDSIDGLKVLERAHTYLRAAVAGVPAGRWDAATPCDQWTVRQVLNHARLDQLAYAAAIAGEGGPQSDPFQPADVLGGHHVQALDGALAAVADAFARLPADAACVPTPLGLLPVWLGAVAAALDAGIHAWDIAVATGQHLPLEQELAEGLWAAADQLVDRLRDSFGVFAPALQQARGGDRASTLLAFVGRDPHWRPAA
jgi:uncharacterized protein (TIGR03086 family)